MQVWTGRVAAGLCVLGALLAGLLGLAAPALAHAVLLDSEPGDGDVVEGAPGEIVLVFNEPMQSPATIAVLDPDGEPVGDDAAEADGDRVRRALDGLSDDGVYTVQWRAVSADDHLISGELTFEVVDAAPEPAPAPSPAATAERDEPTPVGTPTPAPLPTEEPAAATEDAGGPGLLAWLLGGAVLLAAVATVAALRAGHKPGT